MAFLTCLRLALLFSSFPVALGGSTPCLTSGNTASMWTPSKKQACRDIFSDLDARSHAVTITHSMETTPSRRDLPCTAERVKLRGGSQDAISTSARRAWTKEALKRINWPTHIGILFTGVLGSMCSDFSALFSSASMFLYAVATMASEYGLSRLLLKFWLAMLGTIVVGSIFLVLSFENITESKRLQKMFSNAFMVSYALGFAIAVSRWFPKSGFRKMRPHDFDPKWINTLLASAYALMAVACATGRGYSFLLPSFFLLGNDLAGENSSLFFRIFGERVSVCLVAAVFSAGWAVSKSDEVKFTAAVLVSMWVAGWLSDKRLRAARVKYAETFGQHQV